MQIGFIGLGKMGVRIVEKLVDDGQQIIGWNRTKEVGEQLVALLTEKKIVDRFELAPSITVLVAKLSSPKVVWLMLPAHATEEIFKEVTSQLEKGDIIIDGGNAFYKDTERRYQECLTKGIRFLGIGVSGGIIAERTGYPFMVGGDKSAYEYITSVLDSLAKPEGGHSYFGTGGAGHFVKMVHNGIEYGMMQAIGEGFGVLEKSPYDIDLLAVAKNWQKGTIVDSFLIDRASDALEKDKRLSNIIGEIDATGEAEWTVNQAIEEGVFVENINQSLDFRRRSKTDENVRNSFAARMVSALRGEFGGHAVKKK